MNLNQRFDALDDHLKLDPAERDRAIAAHNRLGDILVAAGVAKRTRLQGSFARKTMLPPLKDIDKVVELDDHLWEALAGPGGPERAMTMIGEALASDLPGTRFEIKRHALGIVLLGETFAFDAVPGFNPEDGSGRIIIADTDDDAWEDSNAYLLIDTISTRNQACGGRFVHQVRMIKQAVRTAGLSAVLPGLHVETFAFDAIAITMDHAGAVAAALAAGARMLGRPYTDPTGTDRVSNRLSPADIATASAGMRQLVDRASEAQRLAADGDETGAGHLWADIFGDPFPRPTSDEAKFLAALHAGGSLTGTSLISSARSTPRTRAWRPA